MRKLLIVISGLVSLVFLIGLIGSFAVSGKIQEAARSLVLEKTAAYSEKGAATAEELIESPLSKNLLSDKQRAAITDEIKEYRSDPTTFVARLTSPTAPPEPQEKLSKLRVQFLGWKEALRRHYNKTLVKLLGDLRIFCVTNIFAGLLGLLLAYKSRGRKARILLIYCGLLLFAIGSAVHYYIDSMGFFTILFDGFIGWGYPLVIALTFAGTYWYIGRHVVAMVESLDRQESAKSNGA